MSAVNNPFGSPTVYTSRIFIVATLFLASLAVSPVHAQGPVKFKKPTATPIELIKAKKDFKIELLYSVPRETQGSWVNMTVDDKGRLIVSDQGGNKDAKKKDVTGR